MLCTKSNLKPPFRCVVLNILSPEWPPRLHASLVTTKLTMKFPISLKGGIVDKFGGDHSKYREQQAVDIAAARARAAARAEASRVAEIAELKSLVENLCTRLDRQESELASRSTLPAETQGNDQPPTTRLKPSYSMSSMPNGPLVSHGRGGKFCLQNLD